MDFNEVVQAARVCVTRAIANEGLNWLNLKDAVQGLGTKDWHITTDCSYCDRKCGCHTSAQDARSAEQNEQPSRSASTSVSWVISFKSFYRIFILYPGATAGLATSIALYFDATGTMEKALVFSAGLIGMIIGYFVEGRRWQNRQSQRPDSKGKS